MASFGSTKCARNSVSRAKSCDACVVGGNDGGRNGQFSAWFWRYICALLLLICGIFEIENLLSVIF